MYRIVIPARFAASRFPGKPLVSIAGKPMLQWVFEHAGKAGAAEILIATDDERIRAVATGFGASVCMTEVGHASGTDRIAEVARARGWGPQDIVVNVQGDEPLIEPALIRQVANMLERDPSAGIATLATPIQSVEALLDPNVVKVVTAAHGGALYFSRAPIPWVRDGATAGVASQTRFDSARRHLGLYAYRVATLCMLAARPPSELEQLERLEQLRALEAGVRIVVADAEVQPGPDVNTPEDLAGVECRLRGAAR